MAISLEQRSTIDLTDYFDAVPDKSKEAAAERVGLFLINDIESKLNNGESPVAGYGSFQELSTKYADTQKNGDKIANLWLKGTMQNSLDWELNGNELIIGVSPDQGPKADGHNNFSGDSKLPTRRFLAETTQGEVFKAQDKALELISLFESDIEDALTQFKNFVKEGGSGATVTAKDFAELDPYTRKEYERIQAEEARQTRALNKEIDNLKFKQKISGKKTRAEVSIGGITLSDLRGLF
jgi:hypothetical protein